MNKTSRWISVLLALIALVLIGWNITNETSSQGPVSANEHEPTYRSNNTSTVVYDPAGTLIYRLIAENVAWYENESESWFSKPIMSTYDEHHVPTWSVRANKAKLTHDKLLYLYGNVEVNSLTTEAQIKQIRTNNALVNLVTQDVTSDDQVTLHGQGFTSVGMRMRGNLRTKTAELIEKVKTYYEIQNRSK